MTGRERMDAFNEYWFAINDMYEKWAKRHGIGSCELFILCSLSEGGHSQKEICDKWLFPKQTVCGIVKNFHGKGLVAERTSDADRRRKIVVLTEEGERYAKDILDGMRAAEELAMEKMGGDGERLCELNFRFSECLKEEFERAEC